MFTRRAFLQTAAASAATILAARKARGGTRDLTCFRVHPFIDANPDAVFLLKTNVAAKTDAGDIWTAGRSLGDSLFLLSEPGVGAVPLTANVAVKPNITCRSSGDSRYTRLGTMGIVTDSNFVGGLIQSITNLGVKGSQVFVREVNCYEEFLEGGYPQMCTRTGAHLDDLDQAVGTLPESSIVWKDVPDGVFFNRLPYLRPVNEAGTWLLNVAKFKTHGMGLTLTAKNIQGAIVHNYQAHCSAYGQAMNVRPGDVRADGFDRILQLYNQHVAAGIPRWDRPDPNGGRWMETWAQRCLDNNSVTTAGLHIIEGIYGRDGNFIEGPGPGGLATDYMTNILLFGKNPFHVDTIGHWLGGHEPGNFGLFHLARERKLSSILNPMAIPFYEWKLDGTATRSALAGVARTPLKTYYLQRNYAGQTEEKWHLVSEPYAYAPEAVASQPSRAPEAVVLEQNYPNPFNGATSIKYSIPHAGGVSLDVFDANGAMVERLVGGYRMGGEHLASWNSGQRASGLYFCRLRFEGYSAVAKMILVR